MGGAVRKSLQESLWELMSVEREALGQRVARGGIGVLERVRRVVDWAGEEERERAFWGVTGFSGMWEGG